MYSGRLRRIGLWGVEMREQPLELRRAYVRRYRVSRHHNSVTVVGRCGAGVTICVGRSGGRCQCPAVSVQYLFFYLLSKSYTKLRSGSVRVDRGVHYPPPPLRGCCWSVSKNRRCFDYGDLAINGRDRFTCIGRAHA